MMGNQPVVPDAWDDDWESQADKEDSSAGPAHAKEEVKLSKAERLARHAEQNKKLWQAADEPETFHFLAARDNIPLKADFKPALQLLSRKPAPKLIQRVDPVTGLAKLSLDDEEDEEQQKKDQPSAEELRLRAQKERDEKQRRYDEARARILGTPSGNSSPGTTTPPTEDTKAGRGKSRARGNGRQESHSQSPRPQSSAGSKELYDPNYTAKSGVSIQKRNGETSWSGRSTPRDEDQIIRAPRGPDSTGRGFGIAKRGGKIG